MDEKEILKKIEDVVSSVPNEVDKYPGPVAYAEEDWAKESPKEKGFDIIERIIMEYSQEIYSQEVDDFSKDDPSLIEIDLGDGPRFYSNADENMFFNAIYTMPSYTEIIGSGRGLYLYCKDDITKEEVIFLTDLLKRYDMEISSEVQELYDSLIKD